MLIFSSVRRWSVSRERNPDPEATKKPSFEKDFTWEERHRGFFFTPSSQDIGALVKLTCHPARRRDKEDGAPYSVHSRLAVSAGPGSCPFETRHAFTSSPAPQEQIRTVCYNLLADLYADSDFSRRNLFPYCPPYALDMEYRRQLLLKEILGYNADLVCLQEVDSKVFDFDLSVVLKQRGDFEGDFSKKGGQVSEGCACFWRRSKFELIFADRVILGERLQAATEDSDPLSDMLSRVRRNEQLSETMLQRTTALQVVALRSRAEPSRAVVVGNTHLYFRPDADHIRLLQVGVSMSELGAAVERCKKAEGVESCSLVLCGDFNSTPPFGVLEFMRSGSIPEGHADWRSCPGEEVEGLSMGHPFGMDTACGTPKYTNYTSGFKDCLDYIFYEKDAFKVRQVVPFPSEEELSMNVAIPNMVFPSDHVACVADLEFVR